MTIIFPMPGNERLGGEIAALAGIETGRFETRRFPDQETYLRLRSEVTGRHAIILCTLAGPDDQFLRLIFAARLLREAGAQSVRLFAPYLAYMRQDMEFRPGEAITSRHFADLLSREFDGLVTIDPHLHRYRSLGEIYSIPAAALSAAPLLANWIGRNVRNPVIIGPDSESEQWVSEVGTRAGAPFAIGRKRRLGDAEVSIEAGDLSAWKHHTPVLVDDIASSGRTLAEMARHLSAQGLEPPICMVVHALFGPAALPDLSPLARTVVSTDTIGHPTNAISVAPLLAEAVAEDVGPATGEMDLRPAASH